VRRHGRGFHHLGLTVRDADASAAWYVEVLGFHRVGEFESPDGTRRKVFLRHDGLPVRLGLTQRRHGSQDVFDETRVGLDHLAFAVADRATLDGGGSDQLPHERPATVLDRGRGDLYACCWVASTGHGERGVRAVRRRVRAAA
jgi:catechol 2,3-dioxygenase-like lactoylglutathione lyase family enzyme